MRIDLLEQALDATTSQCEGTRNWLIARAADIAAAQNAINAVMRTGLPLGEVEIWTTTGPAEHVSVAATISARHHDRLVDVLADIGLRPATALREGRSMFHQTFQRPGAGWLLHVHFEGRPLTEPVPDVIQQLEQEAAAWA